MRKLSLVLVVVFSAAAAFAQQERMREGRPFERIEQWRKVRLIEMLDLKEEQSVRFLARMNEHDSLRRSVMREKGEALDKVERLVRNHAAGVEFEKVIPEVLAADQKIQQEQRRFFEGLSDILTPEQRGKLLLFERHFERELREAMREAQRRRSHPEGP